MNVLFTPQAETLWFAALDYIRSDRPTAAIAFRDKVVKSLSRLEAFPQSGVEGHDYSPVRAMSIPQLRVTSIPHPGS